MHDRLPFVERNALLALQRSRGVGRLSVKHMDDATRVAELYQEGSAKIRLPKINTSSTPPEGAQAILINSSGGMTGGDCLDWRFELQQNTKLTVTTQACERIYRSPGGNAKTDVSIAVMENAALCWLPQETILFDEARFQRSIEVDLHKTSEALFVETVLFGRKAMEEKVNRGTFHDRWRIHRDGRLIHAEDMKVEGNIFNALNQPVTMNGNCALATIVLFAPRSEALLTPARETLAANGLEGGFSCWDEKLLGRIIAKDGYSLRKALILLTSLLNNGAKLPRTWTL